MAVTALPDLNVLPAEALRALILAQHEQLLSREREIEHLKLLLVKLHRMQFGRKSEKLQRQIEQLELRLEELESNRSEKEPNAARTGSRPRLLDSNPSEARTPRSARSSAAANAPARAERNGVPAMPGRVTQVGRRCFGDAGVRARQFRGDSACTHEAELHEVRLHCAGGSAELARSSAA